MSRRISLRRKDPQTLTLSGLDAFFADLLREIPMAGTPGALSEDRLFPSPTEGRDREADADWREYVRPELEEQFSESRSRIAADLELMRDTGRKGFELDIPEANRWEWIHGLNQARLALATVHGLGEEELEELIPLQPAAAMAAFQIQFYALLQEWLLTEFQEDAD